MKFKFTQWQNLPTELAKQMRFAPSVIDAEGKKKPIADGKINYAKPQFYSTAEDAVKTAQGYHYDTGFAALDICGYGKLVNYAMLDFDHVLDPQTGEFVHDDAARWYNFIQNSLEGCYAEVSSSGTGIHIIAEPTQGKFNPITDNRNGVLWFDSDKNIKLEIFYFPHGKRKTCHMTGVPFGTVDRRIAKGTVVDDVIQQILDEIQKRLPPEQPKTKTKPTRTNNRLTDFLAFDLFRAQRMLDAIKPAELKEDAEWFKVISAAKNIGVPYETVDAFNQRDPERYDAQGNKARWDSVSNTSIVIGALYNIAERFGYSEKDTRREWYQKIRDMCEWNYKKNRAGDIVRTTIKPTAKNMQIIFENDPNLSGLFGVDRFQDTKVFLKPAPWHAPDQKATQWRDSDELELRFYLRRSYAELANKDLVAETVTHYQNRNAFHPVKNFFEGLPHWDGEHRAETLFAKFLGAEDSEYTREVTMKWLLGAIARVFEPGCDFQWALVLNGAQRIGKSKLVKMLGGKEGVSPDGYSWHVALQDSVDDSHAIDALQKGGIIEIEEFSAARKAEVNALKSFISANEDTRRFSYDKRATTRPRHCVFVVTCNDEQFLRDPTGNARFWIIKCAPKKFKRVEGMTPEYIRQVWAEAYARYNELFKDGFNEALLKPSLQMEQKAEEIADSFIQDDGMTTEIKAFLDKKLPPAVIWKLMTKEERRKFFTDGQITFDYPTLTHRRQAHGGRDLEPDLTELNNLVTDDKRKDVQKIPNGTTTLYRFFGSELREHICAAEIFNEAFSTGDKRKAMYRINEILTNLDGWHLGKRLRNADPEYTEQKKPYYRNEDNRPQTPDPRL